MKCDRPFIIYVTSWRARRIERRWAEGIGLELREEFGSFFIYHLNFGKK